MKDERPKHMKCTACEYYKDVVDNMGVCEKYDLQTDASSGCRGWLRRQANERRPTSKVENLIARGAVQTSRKYRTVCVPVAPEKAIALLRRTQPIQYERLVEWAQRLLNYQHGEHYELTPDEFNEWRAAQGLTPVLTGPKGEVCPECRTWTNNHARDCVKGRET